MVPLARDQIPTFVALERQVAATAQLTPEQEAARRRIWRRRKSPSKIRRKPPRRNNLRSRCSLSTWYQFASVARRVE